MSSVVWFEIGNFVYFSFDIMIRIIVEGLYEKMFF